MKFKTPEVESRFKDLCPLSQTIAKDMDNFCKKKYNIEITLTATVSTHEEDKELKRESDTHRTRRAFDVRTIDLPESLIAELCAYTRKRYNKEGARTSDGPALIVYKPHGTGSHLHVQLNRNHSLPEINYGKEKTTV